MARGRIKPEEKPAPRRVSKPSSNGHRSIGSGPPCPEGHGYMYDWGSGKWYCSHSDHGGNGRFYRDQEVA